jgi:hypothetical protein
MSGPKSVAATIPDIAFQLARQLQDETGADIAWRTKTSDRITQLLDRVRRDAYEEGFAYGRDHKEGEEAS